MTISDNVTLNNHATFRKNELLIRKELVQAIRQRRIGLRATEIYTSAKLSRPTFYLHCRNCDDALRRYEASLLYEFKSSATLSLVSTSTLNAEIALTVLLNFLSKHRNYFIANFENQNYYLLTMLLKEVGAVLVLSSVARRDDLLRLAIAVALIDYWGQYEDFNTELIPYYINFIQHPRLPRW